MNTINRYYEILGLKPGASQAAIKQAYRQLARNWHPDRFPDNPQLKQKAEEEFKKINEAYQRLKSEPTSLPNQTPRSPSYSTHTNNAEIYYNQGVENDKVESYQEAIENLTQAIRLNPNYIEAYKYRGFVCSKLGYLNRAKSDLKKAEELELKQKRKAASSKPPTPSKPPSSASPPPKSPTSYLAPIRINP
jgi:curved DNA-binding protein CbpA